MDSFLIIDAMTVIIKDTIIHVNNILILICNLIAPFLKLKQN